MKELKVSEALAARRAVRVYDISKKIDSKIVKKCIEQATLAPSSSNLQLWEFYHVTEKNTLTELSKACFNQNAAKTASQLIAIIVRKDLWKKRAEVICEDILLNLHSRKKVTPENKKKATLYYKKGIPKLYSKLYCLFRYISFLVLQFKGIFKPVSRQVRNRDMRISAHKSVGLAAQSFMLSMAAYGYDTCPMEGFDSLRVKKILHIPKKAEICMLISCGIRAENGVYGNRFRVPIKDIYFKK